MAGMPPVNPQSYTTYPRQDMDFQRLRDLADGTSNLLILTFVTTILSLTGLLFPILTPPTKDTGQPGYMVGYYIGCLMVCSFLVGMAAVIPSFFVYRKVGMGLRWNNYIAGLLVLGTGLASCFCFGSVVQVIVLCLIGQEMNRIGAPSGSLFSPQKFKAYIAQYQYQQAHQPFSSKF